MWFISRVAKPPACTLFKEQGNMLITFDNMVTMIKLTKICQLLFHLESFFSAHISELKKVCLMSRSFAKTAFSRTVSGHWSVVTNHHLTHSRTTLKDLYLVQVTGWHKKRKTHRIRKPADVESQDDDEKSLRDLEQKRKNSHISPKPFINLRCQTLSSVTTTEKKI